MGEDGEKAEESCHIPKNSSASNILFVVTVLEWQAQYKKLATFDTDKGNSLSRAIRSQLREFKSGSKPYQCQKIYDG